MKLYEISAEMRVLDEFDLSLDGSDDDSFAELYGEIKDKFEDKVENIVKLIKNLEGDIDPIDSEIKRLQAKKKTIENKVSRLKSYIQYEMEAVGFKTLETSLFKLNIQKNQASLIIDHEDMIPNDYVITTFKIDNASVKEALKEGKVIPGAHLAVTESLRIR